MKAKDEINEYFSKMNENIDVIVDKVEGSLDMHRKEFFDKFKGDMYNIHQTYRELLELTNEDLNKMKLKKEIHDRRIERNWFSIECNKMDHKYQDKQLELFQLKDKHFANIQDKKFLEEQIIMAKENKVSLGQRKKELEKEL